MKLKMKALILFALLLALTFLVRPSFASIWEKAFGGTEGDWGLDVGPTKDGGYIMVGESYSYGLGGDVLLVKTDAAGNKIWRKNFGGNNVDQGHSVQQTIDGGYILVGRTKSYGNGGYDVHLIKTYENGDLNWSKTFGGSYADGAFSVRQTSDLGFIIAGYTEISGPGTSKAYIIKTDMDGNYQWSQTLGGSNSSTAKCVRETNDGGYIIAGSINSNQGDLYLVKMFSDGDIDWIKTFGQTTHCEYSDRVEQTTDGGYILSGSSGLPAQDKFDYHLLKTDGSGTKSWDKIFPAQFEDLFTAVVQTLDGGFALVGGEGVFPDLDVYLIKTDSSGNFTWSETFGGAGTDGARSIIQSPDGGIVIGGTTTSIGAGNSDFYLIYYKPDTVAGDFNNDGDVDGLDLAAFIANPNGVILSDLAENFRS